jgi:LysM repeat protein
MNESFPNNSNPESNNVSQNLYSVVEETRPDPHFVHDLEGQLLEIHSPKPAWSFPGWELTSTLGWLALTIAVGLLMVWSIQNLIPAPQPADDGAPTQDSMLLTPTIEVTEDNAATPIPDGKGYDFRGAKLILNAPLPDSPDQANIYNLLDPQPATAEYARSLADQFGIAGEVYIAQPLSPDTSAFMVTDGKQQLIVYTEKNYTYTSNMVENLRNYDGFRHEDAENIIHEYLKTHGFDFNYRFEENAMFGGGYALKQLSPDGLPMEDERYPQFIHVTLDQNGDILSMNVTLMNYDPASLGTYGIISAEEALQRVLDDTLPAGKIENSYDLPDPNSTSPQTWHHEYPDNQTVTIYGNILVSKALDANKPAVIFFNSVPVAGIGVTGNTNGMDSLEAYAFIQATGQFTIENGVRKFNVDTWDQNVEQAYVRGYAHHEGEQIIFTTGDENITEYILVDPPTDLPLDIQFPESQLNSDGAIVDGQFYWNNITYFTDSSQMGGGGGGFGGSGFYPLNLSGVPIPFPSPIQPAYSAAELAGFLRYTVQAGDTLQQIAAKYNVSVEDIMSANYMQDASICIGCPLVIPGVPGPTRLDGERGIVQVMIYEKPDGRQRTQYVFLSEKDLSSYELKGSDLEALQNLANRPIAIWGSIGTGEMGMHSLEVEKYETPYANLQFQVLTGTKQIKEIDEVEVVLFTTGDTTYVLLGLAGGYPAGNYFPEKEMNVEALQVPGETYAGYPAIRVFSGAPAIDPYTGEPVELLPTADEIEVMSDPFGNADAYNPPNVTIDKAELVYYYSNPPYPEDHPEAQEQYIQPAWHFHGHNDDGSELDIFIQALKPEYLSPGPTSFSDASTTSPTPSPLPPPPG